MKKRPNPPKKTNLPAADAPARRNLRRLGILFLNFTLFYALFRLLIALGERTGQLWIYYTATIVYGAAAAGLVIGFFLLNGCTFDQHPRTREELPDRWTEEKRDDFLAKQPARRETARRLLYILLPLAITLLLSYIELNFFKF